MTERLRPRGAHRADLRGFGRGRLRRLDQPRGDAALVPLRPRLGHAGGRGRSPGGRKGPGGDAQARRQEGEAQGEYTLIDRPHRLVMTWTFDDDPSNEQLIELSFSESDGSTTVLMVNSGISTDERRDAQDCGMARVLERPELCEEMLSWIRSRWSDASPRRSC